MLEKHYNEHYNVLKILLWHCLAALTLIGVRGQIQNVLDCSCTPMKILFIYQKLEDNGLKIVPSFNSYTFMHCMWGILTQSPLKSSIIVHHHFLFADV